jgi:hypothetical protein
MIAFEIFIDGQKKCTAGVSGWTAVHAGHGEDGGSRLTVDRERTDPTWTERRKQEYYERLKREYGEA